MNTPSGFKPFQSKPITRLAHEITDNDVISRHGENLYQIKIPSGPVLSFMAYETVKTGDYVVFLDQSDIYHCRRDIFHERNIVQ